MRSRRKIRKGDHSLWVYATSTHHLYIVCSVDVGQSFLVVAVDLQRCVDISKIIDLEADGMPLPPITSMSMNAKMLHMTRRSVLYSTFAHRVDGRTFCVAHADISYAVVACNQTISLSLSLTCCLYVSL